MHHMCAALRGETRGFGSGVAIAALYILPAAMTKTDEPGNLL